MSERPMNTFRFNLGELVDRAGRLRPLGELLSEIQAEIASFRHDRSFLFVDHALDLPLRGPDIVVAKHLAACHESLLGFLPHRVTCVLADLVTMLLREPGLHERHHLTLEAVEIDSLPGAVVPDRDAVVCQRVEDHHDRGPASTMGWEVFPHGFRSTLERFSSYGLPLLVTDNGIATEDEALRRQFLLQHVAAGGGALENGINLIGYLYWSLIDNFEWAQGTAPRFGLASVDYQTQERQARPCVREFARICRENRVAHEPQ